MDYLVWKSRTESKKTVSMRVDIKLWDEFQKRSKLLNLRYEADLLEMILKKALYPKTKLLKVIAADMVEYFDFLSKLRERAEIEEKIEPNTETFK